MLLDTLKTDHPLLARISVLVLSCLLPWQVGFSQSSVKYNNQQLFLSGSNLAWLSFANDIGPGTRDFTAFGDVLLQMHNHGGNALRWWLHTNGTVSPAFNDTGAVIGPGDGTIESLRKALDIAWQREIGMNLCLWSFDMLRSTNSSSVVARNLKLLSDTTYISAYINNCLIPMVDSLKRHPAIIAWEIFNEPEGMSNEFYFHSVDPHVPMSTIQRFVNLCAGAIHRRDSTAQVTNGAWSFKALTDVPLGSLAKSGSGVSQVNAADRQQMLRDFNKKYGFSFSSGEFDVYLQRIAASDNYNYYSDNRLIAAGGDQKGTLDFYSVHYYDWGGTPISPLHHPSGTWLLTKPIVVAEFALKDTYGVMKQDIYKTLFRHGYAGALAWSWTDAAFSSPEDMLAGMRSLWDNYKSAVDVHGVGGDWANVTITRPANDTVLAASAPITIEASAAVTDDGRVVKVEFFADDTLKIGDRTTAPYSAVWNNPPSGYHTLTALATGNLGHKSSSNRVRIQVGTPSTIRLEAEAAAKEGDLANMFVRSLQTASGGAYIELRTQTGKITWTLPPVSTAGTYDITFGFRMSFAAPKTQVLNVNDTRIADVVFDGAMSEWLEKKQSVTLVKGSNTIQLELSWGWMDLDYLAVPRGLSTVVENDPAVLPQRFLLEQNYPNPFNPSTTVKFALPVRSHVSLVVYDVLGRRVAELLRGELAAGHHAAVWTAGESSGVYYCVMEAEPVIAPYQRARGVIKLLLIR
ncbi:MAG: Ig-like domain-containing protein [Ignavibacteriales bacterium]|nr:Ig-like domain-containing protein [Ignavibacteriales bacterium]